MADLPRRLLLVDAVEDDGPGAVVDSGAIGSPSFLSLRLLRPEAIDESDAEPTNDSELADGDDVVVSGNRTRGTGD